MGYTAGEPGAANMGVSYLPIVEAGEKLMMLLAVGIEGSAVPAGYQANTIVSGIGYSKVVLVVLVYPAVAVRMSAKCWFTLQPVEESSA
jgi:hypothetical protein